MLYVLTYNWYMDNKEDETEVYFSDLLDVVLLIYLQKSQIPKNLEILVKIV